MLNRKTKKKRSNNQVRNSNNISNNNNNNNNEMIREIELQDILLPGIDEQPISIDTLPTEIFVKIISLLSPHALINLARVNKGLRAAVDSFAEYKTQSSFPHFFKQTGNKDKNRGWASTLLNAYISEYHGINPETVKLIEAIKSNDLESIKHLRVEDLLKYDANYRTALYWAKFLKRWEILDHFYSKVQEKFTNGETIDYKKTDDQDATLLYWAILFHRPKIEICSLIDKGSEMTPAIIHLAARQGLLDVVKELLARKPELINQIDEFNKTLLISAVEGGNMDVVSYLISTHNVNINAQQPVVGQSINYNSALSSACIKNNLELVHFLLQKGATIHSNDIRNAAQNCSWDVFKIFLDYSPELLNARDGLLSPLMHAAQAGNMDIVKNMIHEKVRLDECALLRKAGTTALHLAAENGHSEVVNVLLEAFKAAGIVIKTKVDKSKLSKETAAKVKEFEKSNFKEDKKVKKTTPRNPLWADATNNNNNGNDDGNNNNNNTNNSHRHDG